MSPVRTIYEVRQRTWDHSGERSLGYFVDDMMADQCIRACYQQAWTTVMSPTFEPSIWFPDTARETMRAQGFDMWYPNDYNADFPLFYSIQSQLWDQLPSSMQNFTFTLEDQREPMVRVKV